MSLLSKPIKPFQSAAAKGSYIIKFKKGVSQEKADKFYSEITNQGGSVQEKQHDSSATAVLPESFAQQLNSTLQGGDHDIIEYIANFPALSHTSPRTQRGG
ncbi:hypothetical protein QFC19_001660 [Naganishia cerealis]|uniref:Uncharacterized protein n=1 Tax=Naganishia cerealis TaxID=610337 RepID=A0ACC2WF25_9TREE|nr:hypothetical protein QFC19_001660 [Naganishia cerealis]